MHYTYMYLIVYHLCRLLLTISLHVSATLTHFLWLGSQAASLQVGLQVASHLHNMVTQKQHHHKNLVWNVDMRVWRGWRRYYCLLMCEESISEGVRGIATNTVNIGTQYYIYIYGSNRGRAVCTVANTRLLHEYIIYLCNQLQVIAMLQLLAMHCIYTNTHFVQTVFTHMLCKN